MRNPKNKQYNDPWERDWYETGSTRPPKDHGGLIAVLLMLVIFLGGAATLMGVMNVRLFQMLEAQQQKNNDAYLYAGEVLATQATDPRQEDSCEVTVDLLGMKGQTVSKFDRRFFQLPQGYLVTDLKEESVAQQAGIRTGDVIVAVEDQPVLNCDDLSALLEQLQPGQTVKVKVYRRQLEEELEMTVIIPEECT